MPLKTTVIGAYPKPEFLNLPDWFDPQYIDNENANPTGQWLASYNSMGDQARATINKAIKQVIDDQVECGIDIITDGEVARENYVHYHCRHLQGFDFEELTPKILRDGSYKAVLPTITAKVDIKELFLANEWMSNQKITNNPVKVTMPGPMTITDTNVDAFYHDDVKLGADIASALNKEVLSLANAGCKHIQIDEPVFARKPKQALDYGIENLQRVFHNCPEEVTRTVHMCCGYPDRIDREDYAKADPGAYFTLAPVIDECGVNAVSIEDAHCHNDLSLLEQFQNTTIILGVIAIARSKIESIDEIAQRLQRAKNHIDADRLIAAPDCGLGFLSRNQVKAKLKNLSAAARMV